MCEYYIGCSEFYTADLYDQYAIAYPQFSWSRRQWHYLTSASN